MNVFRTRLRISCTRCASLIGAAGILISSCTTHVRESPAPSSEVTPSQQRVTDTLANPTREWLQGLEDDYSPTDDELALVIVYLGGLQEIERTGDVPEAFVSAHLMQRMGALMNKYPDVFGGGETGFASNGLASARQAYVLPLSCEDSCFSPVDALLMAEDLGSCRDNDAMVDALQEATAKYGEVLREAWKLFADTVASGKTPEYVLLYEGFDSPGELVLALAKDLLRDRQAGVDPAITDDTVLERYAVLSAANTVFQCYSEVLVRKFFFYDQCQSWKDSECRVSREDLEGLLHDPCNALGTWKVHCVSPCDPEYGREDYYINIHAGDLHKGAGFLSRGFVGVGNVSSLSYTEFTEASCQITFNDPNDCEAYVANPAITYAFGAAVIKQWSCEEDFLCQYDCQITHVSTPAGDFPPPMDDEDSE